MKTEWKYAKTLKAMPRESGRYLFMNELGSFFVGVWDTHERKLYTQCFMFDEEDSQTRTTTGNVRMARWDFKRSGHVYWAKPGVSVDSYQVWQQCRVSEIDSKRKG